MGFHHIFFSWYLKNPIHTTLIIQKIFQHIIAERTHLKTCFFPRTICEWNRLDLDICKSTYSVFRQHLLKLIWSQSSATLNVSNFTGWITLIKLTRLQLALSHLNEHRFNHNFQNCTNPLCTCSLEVESTSHFFNHALPPL